VITVYLLLLVSIILHLKTKQMKMKSNLETNLMCHNIFNVTLLWLVLDVDLDLVAAGCADRPDHSWGTMVLPVQGKQRFVCGSMWTLVITITQLNTMLILMGMKDLHLWKILLINPLAKFDKTSYKIYYFFYFQINKNKYIYSHRSIQVF